MLGEIKTEVVCEIFSDIEYTMGGSRHETNNIILVGPKGDSVGVCSNLKSLIKPCFDGSDAESKNEGNSDDKKTRAKLELTEEDLEKVYNWESVSEAIYQVDMDLVHRYMKKILLNGGAYLDTKEVKMNEIHYNDLSIHDIHKIYGEYIINFLLTSQISMIKRHLKETLKN